ncbi:MAG: hypothetical protein PW788_03285 [Micavibrio sp.]|nr:hypothetical protein [Micavibrio sp.]
MGKTTALRQALKTAVYPLFEQNGFSADLREAPVMITFRRVQESRISLCNIQWDKAGTARFAVNFGSGAVDTVIAGMPGEKLLPQDAFVHNMPTCGRLDSGRDGGWFAQAPGFVGKLLGKKPRAEQDVMQDVITLLPDIFTFFDKAIVTPRLKFTRKA